MVYYVCSVVEKKTDPENKQRSLFQTTAYRHANTQNWIKDGKLHWWAKSKYRWTLAFSDGTYAQTTKFIVTCVRIILKAFFLIWTWIDVPLKIF